MTEQNQDAVLAKVLCPFCSHPWDASMITAYHSSGSCDTCDYGSETTVTISCNNCKREIYEKNI